MSARTKHIASLVTAALLAVAMTASGQQAPNEETEQAEGAPPRVSLLRPALEAAAESVWVKALDIPDPPAGTWGVVATGTGGGAIFRDADSEAEAWLGTNYAGVMGFGSILGGFFADSDSTGRAFVGAGNYGIEATGGFAGGLFYDDDSDDSGRAWVGHGDYGIEAKGSSAGGYFYDSDSDNSGTAWVGHGNYGVEATGSVAGGYFHDSAASGSARVGYGDFGVAAVGNAAGGHFSNGVSSVEVFVAEEDCGIWAMGGEVGGSFRMVDNSAIALISYLGSGIYAYGNDMGGYFDDLDGSGEAWVARGDYGIEARGTTAGGYFYDSAASGQAEVGRGNSGIKAQGSSSGGNFIDSDGSGSALVAYGNYGIRAQGDEAGGRFVCSAGTGDAYVGYADTGIAALGELQGGIFHDTDDGITAMVARYPSCVYCNGTNSFVQNHPEDPSSVIVYAAPEGDEVATFTRGSARLERGETRVKLSETFKWVTNPDIGLTAHLTPRGDPTPLAVVELSTEEMVVRAPGDAPEGLVFDYIVYGLRIGFEESTVVQEKQREAWIPSMNYHRELVARRPDLARHTALSRYLGQRNELGNTEELDTGRTQALVTAIHEFDPAVDSVERPEQPGSGEVARGDDANGVEGRRRTEDSEEIANLTRSHREGQRVPGRSKLAVTVPEDDEGTVYATSFRPSSGALASLVKVSEAVEPGDVLVIDRSSAGMMRRGFEGHDTGVVGVVTSNAGVVLSSQAPAAGDGGSVVPPWRAELAMAGVVRCKADAGYGSIWPGDLLVSSPNPGHAMRVDAPLPGTIVGKALEALAEGTGSIRVLVMLR